MAPTRCGTLPAAALVKLCFSGKYTERELQDRIRKNGGLVDHLGTADTRESVAENSGRRPLCRRPSMTHSSNQIGKHIGAYATVLHGNVDAIFCLLADVCTIHTW